MNIQTEITFDALTGLLNRKAFLEELTRQLSIAKSKNHETPLSVALLDIDFFFQINEDYGHLGGDNAISGFADVIREIIGDDVSAARYGGDEFALLMPGQEREQAFLLLEQIRVGVKAREFDAPGDRKIRNMSISGGLATFPVDGRTEYELLRKASQALYRAKMGEKGQIRLAYEERMLPKTAHFTQTQLERLGKLAEAHNVNEADLLRESVDDLLTKYEVNDIES
ncbi:MAG: GGDEF domain-containing protein [Anaerolineaceae bacterium]|jgi:diguanylate cyclase (GGDEF)-like protein|nr:GGDEF domain-containing protein [Anaerolineaceae bacterium]